MTGHFNSGFRADPVCGPSRCHDQFDHHMRMNFFCCLLKIFRDCIRCWTPRVGWRLFNDGDFTVHGDISDHAKFHHSQKGQFWIHYAVQAFFDAFKDVAYHEASG